MKEQITTMPAGIETFIGAIKVNKMYELLNNPNFKWVMIEHNE